tara:strand:+ start:3222 stop:3569 length:348 start_codon:yes stop_codon:yes gene_type:complete
MRALIWAYGFLITAIAAEVIGTTLLAKSAQFTRLWPSIGMLAAYGVSFYLLTLVLKTIPLGVAYAIWGGLGIVATTLIGAYVLRQPLDTPAIAGIAAIVFGVILINGFSAAASHG